MSDQTFKFGIFNLSKLHQDAQVSETVPHFGGIFVLPNGYALAVQNDLRQHATRSGVNRKAEDTCELTILVPHEKGHLVAAKFGSDVEVERFDGKPRTCTNGVGPCNFIFVSPEIAARVFKILAELPNHPNCAPDMMASTLAGAATRKLGAEISLVDPVGLAKNPVELTIVATAPAGTSPLPPKKKPQARRLMAVSL